jgi:pSer/pThr/pTyr-binding forkhead associated (FHA) protein
MKIVLVEERSGIQMPEKSFSQETIRIGRDVNECQIVFDNAQFPMVSRRHAELRRQNNQWVFYDLNSSYGTFVDGRRLPAPQPVQIGNRLQFGAKGPVMRVVSNRNHIRRAAELRARCFSESISRAGSRAAA